MSLAKQIEELEVELQDFRDGTTYKEMDAKITRLERERDCLTEELNDYENDNLDFTNFDSRRKSMRDLIDNISDSLEDLENKINY